MWLEQGRRRCWRGGQAQAAQGFGGQGRRWGTAAEVPPVTGSTDSSWPPCEEVTKGRMREAAKVRGGQHGLRDPAGNISRSS